MLITDKEISVYSGLFRRLSHQKGRERLLDTRNFYLVDFDMLCYDGFVKCLRPHECDRRECCK